MRSAVMLGLVVLAGCKEQATDQIVTVDLPTSVAPAPAATPTAQPAIPPQVSVPAKSAVKNQHFQALGTEPFWSLEVIGDKLLYSSPEQLTAVAITASLSNAGPQLRYTAVMDGKPVVLTIEAGTCSDGMSDTVYSHKASFTWGDQTERGCARLK